MVESERPKSVVDALEVLGTPRSTWNRLRGTFALTDTRIQNAQSILNDKTFDSALWQTVLEGYDVNTSDASIGSLYDRQQGLCEAASNYEKLEIFLTQYKLERKRLSPQAQSDLQSYIGIDFDANGNVDLKSVLKFLKEGKSPDLDYFSQFSKAYAINHGGSFETRKANIERQVFGKYSASIKRAFAPLGGLLNSRKHADQVANSTGPEDATLVRKYRSERRFWMIGLTALGVAAAIATGGTALPLIALITGTSVAASAAVNNHRINQITGVKTLRDKETNAYIAEKTAYIHGNSPERQAALENADLVFTVSGIHQNRFITAQTAVNLATGKVMLGEMAEKYAGLVDAYFVDSSGTFDIIPTQKAIGTMDNDAIKKMVQDILVHSNLGDTINKINVKAGDEIYKNTDISQTNIDFLDLAKRVQSVREEADLQAKLDAALTNSDFIKTAVAAGLAGAIGKTSTDNGPNSEYQDAALALLQRTNPTLYDQVRDNPNHIQLINNSVNGYLNKNFGIQPSDKYPVSDSASKIAESATKQLFGVDSPIKADRLKATIALSARTENRASPELMALMVNTGFRFKDLDAISDLRNAWNAHGNDTPLEQKVASLTSEQKKLVEKIATFTGIVSEDENQKISGTLSLVEEALAFGGNQTQPNASLPEEPNAELENPELDFILGQISPKRSIDPNFAGQVQALHAAAARSA